ncbi:hypothetical protein C6499_04225 [Candidatus Poribacteria bacterium]|nr:MAG: hypothetical protein C6499_04225 [Candidatus Poribacteria bacterium]
MNRHFLQKAFRSQYRIYAFRISLILHLLMGLALSLFIVKSQLPEGPADAIQVDIISYRPPKQRLPKKPPALPKTEKIEPQTPVLEKRKVEKQVNARRVEAALEIAKMPASVPKDITVEHTAMKQIGVEAPAFSESSDLSTDADLARVPEAVLSPLGTSDAQGSESRYTKRRGTGVRNPAKGAADGIEKLSRKTTAGTGKAVRRVGTGEGSGSGTSQGSATFSSIIGSLTDDIIASSGGGPIDVVFVVDASGSMGDNINAVAEHLGQMVDAYKTSEIDYRLGLTRFAVSGTPAKNAIHVSQLTQNLSAYKQELYNIIPTGDENALDAIHQTLIELRFRSNTVKHLILVTDEPFTTLQGLTVTKIIEDTRRSEIYVNVLGLQIAEHQRLAEQTGGTWHAVPENPKPQSPPTQQIHPQQARWPAAKSIGDAILTDAAHLPVDIILFIDGSKSMADKMPEIRKQIDQWRRSWDNALIDYQLGVIRFYASGTINRVNVFDPPQTPQQLHKILQLPPQDDENLLQAVVDGAKRIKRRANAKTHFILITDEPGDPKYPIAGTIGWLKEMPVVVNVWGTRDPFQQQAASQTGGVFITLPNAYTHNATYH